MVPAQPFPYLLLPSAWSSRNRARCRERGDLTRGMMFGAVGVVVCWALFQGAFWLTTQLASYEELGDYLLRLDDEVNCKTCGKKFEIPSQHSLMFVDQLEGLPKDDDLDAEIAAASGEPDPPAEAKPKLPDRFTRPSRGWRG